MFILVFSMLFVLATNSYAQESTPAHRTYQLENKPTETQLTTFGYGIEEHLAQILHAVFGLVKDASNQQLRVYHIRTILFGIFQVATMLLYGNDCANGKRTFTACPLLALRYRNQMHLYAAHLQAASPNHNINRILLSRELGAQDATKSIALQVRDIVDQFTAITNDPHNETDVANHLTAIYDHILDISHAVVEEPSLTNNADTVNTLAYEISNITIPAQ